ncbi:hypothetical protein M0R72_15900 [Candidatus Pacearchaeota archaeon]|jgi:hypothetical protein|nr:hypothetical protein [Candidatus Pacearchaeota archaeon]
MSNFIGGSIASISAYSGTLTAAQILASYTETIDPSYQSATDAPFEQAFYGTADKGAFSRSSRVGALPVISISADDMIKDIAKRKARISRYWENYYHARATPSSNSLLHEYVWLGTRKELDNYLGNSGFENATIGNSWLTDATLTRSNTVALNGTYSGYINGAGYIRQSLTIDLSEADEFTFQIYAYNTNSETITLSMAEYSGATLKATSTSVGTSAGTGWQLYSVTHTAIDSTSNKLTCTATTTAATYFDMAILSYGGVKTFYIDNTNDGTTGVISYTLAKNGYFYPLGIDAENVSYTHSWATINKGQTPWELAKQLFDASLCRYLHIDQAGVLVFRSSQASDISASAMGSLPKPAGLSANNQPLTANKITVEGVRIEKQTFDSCVWQAKNAILDDSTSTTVFRKTLTTASPDFPDPDEHPNGLEIVYGLSESESSGAKIYRGGSMAVPNV